MSFLVIPRYFSTTGRSSSISYEKEWTNEWMDGWMILPHHLIWLIIILILFLVSLQLQLVAAIPYLFPSQCLQKTDLQ